MNNSSPKPGDRKSIVKRRLPQLIPAKRFGRYTLVAKLGRGGMAEVFLGYQAGPRGFRKPIVIKRILSDLAEDPRLVQMFFDEARLAARLHHPHVVQTIDVGEVDGSYFLAMEYLEGQPLSEVIRRSRRRYGGVQSPIAARVICDALEGLHYAHELKDFDGTPMGVVHRDVSPQNVFVTYGGVVKLLDFGVAKAATQVVETRTGAVKGKYAYMAPEQGRGSDIDRRADLWAAGVIFWEALAGRRLFKEKTEYATLKAVMEQPIPQLAASPEAAVFQPVLDRAICREPEERFPDAMCMREAIMACLERDFPRIGRAEIAGFMRELFSDVLEDHERTLGMALNAEERASTITSPAKRLPEIESLQEIPSDDEFEDPNTVPSAAPFDDVNSGVAISSSRSMPSTSRAPDRKRRWIWVVGIFACLGLGATMALVNSESEETLVAPLATESTPEPSNVEAPVAEAVAEAAPGEPSAAPAPPEPAPPEPSADATEAVEADANTLAPEESPGPADPPPVEARENAEALAARAARARAAARERAERSTPNSMSAAESRRAESNASEMATAERSVTSMARMGTLRFNSRPWSSVSIIGGRRLGNTPLVVQLPAGSYSLRLHNSERRITETYSVRIRAGEVTARTISIGESSP